MREMVGGCCVCSDERGWDENPLVYCDGLGCTVAVHQACYGIVSVPTGPWFCRKCEWSDRPSRVRCELCPSRDGALKRTDGNNSWAHVVCALYIPEVRFGNVSTMEPIVLGLVPSDRYAKSCYLCEKQGRGEVKAASGACMQCNRSGCKQSFHVTCAQSQGLLCEEAGNYLDNVKYCGYCEYHYSKINKKVIKTIPAYKPVSCLGSPTSPNAELTTPSSAPVPNSEDPSASAAATLPKKNKKGRLHHREFLANEERSKSASLEGHHLKEESSLSSLESAVSEDKSVKLNEQPEDTTSVVVSEDQQSEIKTLSSAVQRPPETTSNVLIPSTTTMNTTTSSVIPTTISIIKTELKSETSIVSDVSVKVEEENNAKESDPCTINFIKSTDNITQSKANNNEQHPASDEYTFNEEPSTQNGVVVMKQRGRPPKKGTHLHSNSLSSLIIAAEDLSSSSSNTLPTNTIRSPLSSPELESASSFKKKRKRMELAASSSNGIKDEPSSKKKEQGSSTTWMMGTSINPSSNVAKEMNVVLQSEITSHANYDDGKNLVTQGLIGLSLPQRNNKSTESSKKSSSYGAQTLEELLGRQWEQGSQFIMEQATGSLHHFDIASLLSSLNQLKEENAELENSVEKLVSRRDHLLAVRARLMALSAHYMMPAAANSNVDVITTYGPRTTVTTTSNVATCNAAAANSSNATTNLNGNTTDNIAFRNSSSSNNPATSSSRPPTHLVHHPHVRYSNSGAYSSFGHSGGGSNGNAGGGGNYLHRGMIVSSMDSATQNHHHHHIRNHHIVSATSSNANRGPIDKR